MENRNFNFKGIRFKGLTWEEREEIVSHLEKQGFKGPAIAEILFTSRQNIYNVQKRIKKKNFNSSDTN